MALSDQLVRAVDYATGLVSTRNDTNTGLGRRASQAAHLAVMAQTTLAAAVVYERERGTSWADIGHCRDLPAAEVKHRYLGDLVAWQQVLDNAERSSITAGLLLALRDPGALGNTSIPGFATGSSPRTATK